ncbi:MAG: hypothetical protein GKR91_07560 [Pseudomonadales bacterium]|nr:hypothetical protein [Pseudomonadales bacterium]
MASLIGSSHKRILLINAEGLSVFKLEKDRLVHVGKFSDEDVGYENFRNYLIDNPRSPVTLLIDSAAEDFVVESVAHVSIFDRSAFLRRKVDQHFRGSEYRSVSILGRDDSSRRDDSVLFSALTKNEIIDPWVRVLLSEEVPIKSITTPAFALCKIASEYDLLTSDTVLLVNWEESGIRQTFIVDGKMMFSRLTPLPHDPNDDLPGYILDSCNQSREYLERIGLLTFDQNLDVHVITPLLEDHVFSDMSINRNFRKIEHHNSIDMLQIDRYNGPQNSITAVLLCLEWGVRTGKLANQYAPSSAMRFFHLTQARRLIGFVCLALLIVSGLISAPIMLEAIDRSSRIASLSAQVLPVQNQYDALVAEFPETPIPTDAMALAVSRYELIRSQIRSPVSVLSDISRVIARFPAISLSSIEWQLSPANVDLSYTEGLLSNSTQVSVNIYGTLMGSSSIQNSDRQLRLFMSTLGQIQGATITPLELPIESGPDGEVATILDGQAINSDFALTVRLGS